MTTGIVIMHIDRSIANLDIKGHTFVSYLYQRVYDI